MRKSSLLKSLLCAALSLSCLSVVADDSTFKEVTVIDTANAAILFTDFDQKDLDENGFEIAHNYYCHIELISMPAHWIYEHEAVYRKLPYDDNLYRACEISGGLMHQNNNYNVTVERRRIIPLGDTGDSVYTTRFIAKVGHWSATQAQTTVLYPTVPEVAAEARNESLKAFIQMKSGGGDFPDPDGPNKQKISLEEAELQQTKKNKVGGTYDH